MVVIDSHFLNSAASPDTLEHAPSVKAVFEAFDRGGFPFDIDGVHGSFREALALALAGRGGATCLLVTPTEREAEEAAANAASLGGKAALFPAWGLAPYHPAPPLSPVFAARAALLAALAAGRAPPLLIMPLRAFLAPLIPPRAILGTAITLKTGGALDTADIAARLAAFGYTRVPKVQMPGEFVLRGEVLDIFCADGAARVLFNFDTIESIRAFDPIEQNYIADKSAAALAIPPVKELIWTDERIDTLSENLALCEELAQGGKAIIEELIARRTCAGEEYFFHLAFKENADIASYLERCPAPFTLFAGKERLLNAHDALQREYEAAFRAPPPDFVRYALPAPKRVLLPFEKAAARVPRPIFLRAIQNAEDGAALPVRCESPQNFMGNIAHLKETVTALAAQNWRVIVAGESEAQTERLGELLKDTAGGAPPAAVVTAPLTEGFSLPELRFMVIAEAQIFARRARPPRSLKTARSRPLDSFVELNPGDYVVHINYGIGLFLGIERVKALGNERDYIKLRYADDETVFVPIEQVNLIQRYIGNEGASPRLDKLGSKNWEARKERACKAAEELAGRLVALYSKRKAAAGFAFPKDTEWQTMFEVSFPWEETDDQLRCVEEIKADMEQPLPMDRLVCGDVGYGKTEIALRACFKAVMGGKQVAFLAPTNILVEQHYENFLKRFERFPVRVGMLSRFVGERTVKKNLAAARNGELDILVGTHRIIQKDVVFKDLGLLVIDEEQRFGVRDKERLKEMKHNVDCLALSATPIPRTLHMSLLKIRDMSLLTTPPRNRRPIETHIGAYSDDLIRDAIRAEAGRGGQIFFLHNRIQSLSEVRLRLEKLVPELLVETAHGQMDAGELEEIMHRFIQGGFHILVSTTIIENGIDIPNVNTIIIDRADMYGIAQLYQVRGRVGRSDRPAFAYLFYPHDRVLSELAMKRLQAMSDFTELGAGFKIAMKDMEIRGAGNLLGREQSGSIYSVGFDMYMRLLDTAIQKLQDERYEDETEALLELEYSGFIPDEYIAGAQEKMEVYKKIAAVRTKEELEAARSEIDDRFGPPPEEAASLLCLAEIRVICKQLNVQSLRERQGAVRVEFANVAAVNIERALRLVRESAGQVKLDSAAPNALILKPGALSLAEKSAFIREKLAALV